MTRGQTREQLIRIGAEVLGTTGFKATGIEAVLRRADVPKGSFYHYFESKDAFALAVIEHFAAEYSRKLEGFLEDGSTSPLGRVRRYLEQVIANQETSDFKHGCLVGTLAQELAARSEPFRACLDEVFERWRRQFAACLVEAQAAGELDAAADADQLAGFLLLGLEGAILRAKVMRSARPLRELSDVFFNRVVR